MLRDALKNWLQYIQVFLTLSAIALLPFPTATAVAERRCAFLFQLIINFAGFVRLRREFQPCPGMIGKFLLYELLEF